jgi:hypothetical protein
LRDEQGLTYEQAPKDDVFCPGKKEKGHRPKVKNQHLVLLLKPLSLEHAERRLSAQGELSALRAGVPEGWQGRDGVQPHEDPAQRVPGSAVLAEAYTVRGLSVSLGISKTEIAAALRRCTDVGLVRKDRQSGFPRADARTLLGLIEHCVGYVFPATPGALARGIPTAFAAPILADEILSAGDSIFVWPYARGNRAGQGVAP